MLMMDFACNWGNKWWKYNLIALVEGTLCCKLIITRPKVD